MMVATSDSDTPIAYSVERRVHRSVERLLQTLTVLGNGEQLDRQVLVAATAEFGAFEAAVWLWYAAKQQLLLRHATRASPVLYRLFGNISVEGDGKAGLPFGDEPVVRLTLDSSTPACFVPVLRVLKAPHALLIGLLPPGSTPLLLGIGRPTPFSADDVALAVALRGILSQIYSGSHRLEHELQKNRALTAINRATLAISSSLDEREVFQAFADETRRLLKFERASLTLLDDTGKRLQVYALNAEMVSRAGFGGSIPVEGSGVGWVAIHRLPLIREDLAKGKAFAEDPMMLKAGVRSSIHLPLVAHSRVLGTFNLSSIEPYAYNRDDLTVLQPIADQLALAIENASLYGERGRVLAEFSAIQSVTDAALLGLDLTTILEALTRRVSEAMGADVAACFLSDAAGQQLSLRAVYGLPPWPDPVTLRIGEGFAGRVAQAGSFLFVRDIDQDPLVTEPFLRQRGLRALLGMPLQAKGRVLGVLGVGVAHVYRQNDGDVHLLRTLADRVAAVVDHVQLQEELRRNRDELDALYQVSKLTGGSFNVEGILEDLLVAVAPVLPCSSGSLFVVEETTELLKQAASYHFPRLEQPLSFARGEGLVGWVVKHNHAIAVEDCFEDPRFVPAEGIREPCSVLVVPLIAGAKVMAALVLTRPKEQPFTRADVTLAQIVAGHAAQVIENAVLLQSVSDARLVHELDKAKAEFVGAASHELRTPLTAIKGLVETLLRPDLKLTPATRRELLQEINTASNHLVRILEQLLDASRIEAGRLETEPIALDAAELVGGLVARVRALHPGRRIDCTVEPNLPAVRSDPALLEAIVQNLVANALKYSPENAPVSVELAHWERETVDAMLLPIVELRVVDQGPGIAAQDIPKLFRPFSRLHGSQRRLPGAGLGLYISQAFAEAIGAELGVVSEPGEGSIFWVHLPASVGEVDRQAGPQVSEKLARVSPSSGSATTSGSGEDTTDSPEAQDTILVIDDEPAVLRTAELYLGATGYRVLVATSGEEGLALARDRRPDLILLDVLLPGMSGLDVARRLKQHPATRQIPFVYLSAKTQLGERLDGLQAGAAAYITKPFSPGVLAEVVRSLLEQPARERQRRRRAELNRLAEARSTAHG